MASQIGGFQVGSDLGVRGLPLPLFWGLGSTPRPREIEKPGGVPGLDPPPQGSRCSYLAPPPRKQNAPAPRHRFLLLFIRPVDQNFPDFAEKAGWQRVRLERIMRTFRIMAALSPNSVNF
jgi:hypothetical protein